jgi:thioredoxin-dependent peroxiredoxin
LLLLKNGVRIPMATVTFKGNTMNLQGNTVCANQQAPSFELLNSSLQPITLSHFAGKTVLFNVVPSLDTPVCQIQSKTFYQRLAGMPVELVTISMDLPFAQARFCGAENITMQTLSDHKSASFGQNYGLLLPDLRLLTRAVILVNAQGNICYCEVVPEVTSEPNYDAAIAAVEATVSANV